MKNSKNKKIWLYLTEDEVETVWIALLESKLPKSKDNGWNEENEKVQKKIAQMRLEQR